MLMPTQPPVIMPNFLPPAQHRGAPPPQVVPSAPAPSPDKTQRAKQYLERVVTVCGAQSRVYADFLGVMQDFNRKR